MHSDDGKGDEDGEVRGASDGPAVGEGEVVVVVEGDEPAAGSVSAGARSSSDTVEGEAVDEGSVEVVADVVVEVDVCSVWVRAGEVGDAADVEMAGDDATSSVVADAAATPASGVSTTAAVAAIAMSLVFTVFSLSGSGGGFGGVLPAAKALNDQDPARDAVAGGQQAGLGGLGLVVEGVFGTGDDGLAGDVAHELDPAAFASSCSLRMLMVRSISSFWVGTGMPSRRRVAFTRSIAAP